jgi:hypothetical protein
MISFDDLPTEIKIKILSINEENNFKSHQGKFRDILEHIEYIIDVADTTYFEAAEEDCDFSHAMLECIRDENLENMYEKQMEEAIDDYYS